MKIKIETVFEVLEEKINELEEFKRKELINENLREEYLRLLDIVHNKELEIQKLKEQIKDLERMKGLRK